MASEQLHSFMLMTNRDGTWAGLGRHEFRSVPRRRDFISIEENGQTSVYSVLAVIHPSILASNDGDLIVQYASSYQAFKDDLLDYMEEIEDAPD